MHCTTTAKAAKMHSATTESAAVHSASKTTPMERHGWRRRDDCRPYRGHGNATEKFGLHDSILQA